VPKQTFVNMPLGLIKYRPTSTSLRKCWQYFWFTAN